MARERWGRSMLLLLLLVVTAGCLAGEPGPREPPAASPNPGEPGLVRLNTTNVSTSQPATEPVVAVGGDGTLYVQGIGQNVSDEEARPVYPSNFDNNLWRSADGGRSWTEVSPPLFGGNASCDAHVAAVGNATLYVSTGLMTAFPGIGDARLAVWRSADRGDSWTALTPPQPPEPVCRTWLEPVSEDRVHLVAEGIPGSGTWYLRTDDGGETWVGPIPVDERTRFGSSLTLGPNGTLYNARLVESVENESVSRTGPWFLRTSDDEGRSWQTRGSVELRGRLTSGWQPLTVDADGTLYLVWSSLTNGTSLVRYAYSADGGRSWTRAGPVAPGNVSQILPWADAEGSGRLAVSWYEANRSGRPSSMNASWRGHVAVVGNASSTPAIQREARTSWALHEGPVCTDPVRCTRGGSDALADFAGVSLGQDGVHAAFASTRWEEPSAFPVYGTLGNGSSVER